MACDDGEALFSATGGLAVEGVVAKRRSSRYLCGRRSNAWVKVKHRHTGWFDVAGWRPPGRPHPAGAVALAEDGRPAGTAIPALGAIGREALGRLVARYRVAGDGAVLWLPAGVQARVDYLERSAPGRGAGGCGAGAAPGPRRTPRTLGPSRPTTSPPEPGRPERIAYPPPAAPATTHGLRHQKRRGGAVIGHQTGRGAPPLRRVDALRTVAAGGSVLSQRDPRRHPAVAGTGPRPARREGWRRGCRPR